MAGLVKVLQIQPIVPNLFHGGPVESFLSRLEFNHEDYWPDHQDNINPAAHSRDVELQKDIPG